MFVNKRFKNILNAAIVAEALITYCEIQFH